MLCKVLLHAINLRHGTDGFTSPPKEVRATDILSPIKVLDRAGTRNRGCRGKHARHYTTLLRAASNQSQISVECLEVGFLQMTYTHCNWSAFLLLSTSTPFRTAAHHFLSCSYKGTFYSMLFVCFVTKKFNAPLNTPRCISERSFGVMILRVQISTNILSFEKT
jgi:hypothetical protein